LPGVSLANLPRAEAPGIVPWQNARFLVVITWKQLWVKSIGS